MIPATAERNRWMVHVAVNSDSSTMRVAAYVSRFKQRGWICRAAQTTIARALDLSERTVRRALAWLESEGLLGVTRSPAVQDPTTGRFRRKTNVYRIRFRKTKRGLSRGNDRSSPTGQSWPQKISSRGSGVPRPPGAGPLERPQPPPWPPLAIELCEDCQQRPPIPGKWRCQPCQDDHDARPQRRAPRPATLPDPDA